MQMTECCFSPEKIETLGMGAGVIPISCNPNGEVCLLLGRERWMPAWRGSCRWSGFEGSRKSGERMVETACREYMEESMGILSDDVCARVTSGEYWLRVVLKIDHDRKYATERYHSTYIVPVTWDDTCTERFNSQRMRIEHIDRLAQEMRHRKPGFLSENATGHVHYEDGSGVMCIDGVAVDASCTRDVTLWHDVRERLETALIPHQCVGEVRRDHVLQDVVIHRDHLEKDQVRWWTIKDLERILECHGSDGVERFRPYFLPVLQTITQYMAHHPPYVSCETCESS